MSTLEFRSESRALGTRQILILVSAVCLFGLLPNSAQAVCSGERQIFVRQDNVSSAVGVYIKNAYRPSMLDVATGCDEGPSKGSTAHVTLSDSYFEAGWYEYKADTVVTDWLFYEYRVGANGRPMAVYTAHADTGCPCWGQWKIYTTLGTRVWNAWADPELDNRYTPLGAHDMGRAGGVPKAETTVRGTGTSGYDHFTNLKRRSSTGTWYLWTTQVLDSDSMPTYHWSQVSSYEYKVEHD